MILPANILDKRRIIVKKYESPEFEIVSMNFTENMLTYLASVETDIPDIED